jgi:type IV secretory pathway TrbL component
MAMYDLIIEDPLTYNDDWQYYMAAAPTWLFWLIVGIIGMLALMAAAAFVGVKTRS